MGAPVRYLIALVLSALLEFLLIKALPQILTPPPKEVNRVIEISLIKPHKRSVEVKVERKKGRKRVKEERRKVNKLPQPNVTSKKPLKGAPKKEVKKEVVKEKERGGLKPLHGNLPADYVEAVRRAIEKNIFYPLEALEEGIEGPVMVRFTLDRRGKVVECKPLFGQRILEEATCLAIRRSTFPPIPKSVRNDTLTFQLQVEYNLEEALK